MPRKEHAKPVPTRERILKAAKHLFQRRGYFAVSTADILASAKAPKGSMYHHFPDGKEQIAIEGVTLIRHEFMALMHKHAEQGKSVAESIRLLANGMATWLKRSGWQEGTMLISTTIGSVPDLPKLHAAIKEAFDEWRGHIAVRLVGEGWSKPQAATKAQLILSAIEGAMILARIDQDERVVLRVADGLSKMVTFQEKKSECLTRSTRRTQRREK